MTIKTPPTTRASTAASRRGWLSPYRLMIMYVCHSLSLIGGLLTWRTNHPTKSHLIPVLQAGTMVMIQEPVSVNKEVHPLTAAHRPRPTPAAKKSKEPAKPPQDPEAVFPCKKCGRYSQIYIWKTFFNSFYKYLRVFIWARLSIWTSRIFQCSTLAHHVRNNRIHMKRLQIQVQTSIQMSIRLEWQQPLHWHGQGLHFCWGHVICLLRWQLLMHKSEL